MVSVLERCSKLESDELSVGGTIKLTAMEYAELLFFYLVQQKLIDAKYCYLRASAMFKDDILKRIWIIGYKLSKSNFGDALKDCYALKSSTNPIDQQLQPYLHELQNRVTAIQLELIAKCYTSIDQQCLAGLLGLVGDDGQIMAPPGSDDFFTTLLAKCGWSCDEDGFVVPNHSEKLQSVISELIDPDFGELNNQWKKENLDGKALDRSGIESLKLLTASSNFFDSD